MFIVKCYKLHIIIVQSILVQGAVKVSPCTVQQCPALLVPPGSNQYSLIMTYNQSRHFESDGD